MNRLWSVKTRLLVSVSVLVILAIVSVSYLTLTAFEARTKELIGQQQFATVTLLANEIDDKLHNAHEQLIVLSRQLTAEMMRQPARAQDLLDHHLEVETLFSNGYVLFDAGGALVAERPHQPVSRVGQKFLHRDYLATTLRTREPYVGDPYLSSRHGHPVITLTAPVFDRGELVGVLCGSIDLIEDNVLSRLLNIQISSTGYLYLATNDRNLILHPDKSRILKHDIPPGGNALYERALQGFEGSGETVTTRGLHAITSLKRLKTKGWLVGANFPVAEAYAPIRQARRSILVAAALVALLLTGVVWTVMNSLTRPLLAFTRHVEGISAKRGEARLLPVESRDEIGRLTLAFNAMVSDLDRQQAEIESQKGRLVRAEKMEALGTLAGGVAHDLNNVLGVVVGSAELLSHGGRATPVTRPLVADIVEAGQRAAAIVQDLLTLARRGVQTRKVINLNHTIVDLRESPELKVLATRHPNVRVEMDLEPELLNVVGSPVHLGKTVLNLLTNAAEAMPGGGRVAIATRNRYLDRPVRGYDEVKEGDYALLSVADTGEGIDPGDLQRIFEPFYTKKVMGRSGTGLGLAVVWGTVKDHDGYVDVRSELGKGTTFTLFFPVTREPVAEDAPPASISEYMGQGETILVVDDVKAQRELASHMLRTLNYVPTCAASGEEAVELVRKDRFDLVVLDMIMDPGIDGLDTYRRILALRPGQRAIVVSGFSETERVSEAQALGAGAYVRKPYLLERLGRAVKQELQRGVLARAEHG